MAKKIFMLAMAMLAVLTAVAPSAHAKKGVEDPGCPKGFESPRCS